MKILRAIYLVLFVCSCQIYGQWTNIETGFEGYGETVFFTDSLHGSIGYTNSWSDNCIITTFNGGDSWTKSQMDRRPTSVFYSDSLTGYCVTEFARLPDYSILPSHVYKTIDGGLTWSIIHTDTLLFSTIFFINNEVGFIGGLDYDGIGGVLKKTYDGGNSWQNIPVSDEFSNNNISGTGIHFIEMLNDSVGFLGGKTNTYKSEIWKTNDGGENWYKTLSLDSEHNALLARNSWSMGDNNIDFINDTLGIVVGYDCWITYDTGESWEKLDIPAHNFGTISAAGNNFWLGTRKANVLLHSTDFGVTWIPVRLEPNFLYVYSIFFLNDMHGWVAGIGGIAKTVNGGIGKITVPSSPTLYNPLNYKDVPSIIDFNWEPINYSYFNIQVSTDSTFSTPMVDTLLITNRINLEFGSLGQYFWRVRAENSIGTSHWSQTNMFIITDLVNVSNNVPLISKFSLKQNYPNPFNPTTEIHYSISNESKIELNIYNILGEKIAVLVNERKHAGNYKVIFDASELSSGVYIYQLLSNGLVESKKMLLIK